MAAYAAVVSLMNTMNAVMNDPRISTCFHKQQILSLAEKLDVLLQFIENYDYNSLGRDEEAQSLERRITSAAHAAEDVIESHIVAQIRAGVLQNSPTSCIDLLQIMHAIDEIKEEVVKVEVKMGSNDQKPKNLPQPLPTGKMAMIGFDDYLIQLLDGLTGSESGRLVIPIVGMGGVGKTTLTKNAYENLLIVHQFDVRVWVSISQQYDVKNILVQLLSTLGLSTQGKNEGELSECLFKFLCGRRYLVVLDDMWSITAWDEVKFCFPENSNSSRIIITTRLLEVANYFGSSRVARVGLLDDNKSWDLFCYKVFAQQGCPDELEQIGKAIARKCKGLPLLLDVIGALLGNSSQTKEYWANIAENMSSILSSAVDNVDCLDILCLSYNHLPAHLKPCFLYLGIFEEDCKISVSRLIKLWIAEGFIKPNKDKLLEEVAEGYINDLLERSLILVDSLGWDKKFTSFHIHDLVRDLCLREAQKEKFYFVISECSRVQDVNGARRVVHSDYWLEDTCYPFKSVVRSMSFYERYNYNIDEHISGFELLRVSDGGSCASVKYFKNVNMRFLFSPTLCMGNLPPSIFLLWNMQTFLINNHRIDLPVEIWKMRQLRHVKCSLITLPEPPLSDEEDESVVLHNLQTLAVVEDLKISEEVCKRIPNIKRLKVYYRYFAENSNGYCIHNIGRLINLESLSLDFGEVPVRNYLAQNLIFPTSLKELSLQNTQLEWDDMRIIGSLPNLEVLKLLHRSFEGREWTCVEGEFLALKYLEIISCRWTIWNVERSHFPVLDTLFLEFARKLAEIPSGIGDIPTLRIVRLLRCSNTLMISAMKMLEDQETLGNDALQLQLQFLEKQRIEEFLEEVEKEGITCTNFSYTIPNQSTLWR